MDLWHIGFKILTITASLTSLAIFFVNIAIIFSKLKPPWQLQLHNCSELKPPWRPFSLRSASRTCRRRRSVARSSFNMMLYIIIVIIGDKYNALSKSDLASERAPLRRTDRSEQSWNCGEARRGPGLNYTVPLNFFLYLICRHGICQKFYTVGFSGKTFYIVNFA